MTIARAFTKRLGRSESNATMARSESIRKISSPITLLSTTNMISYEAPDVSVARLAMSHAASASNNDYSRKSSESEINASSPPTPGAPSLTDGSSIESSPTLEFNHLMCYFPGASKGGYVTPTMAAPAIPRRAISHSKLEHERLARKRSRSRSARATRESSPTPKSPTQISATTGFDAAGASASSIAEESSDQQSSFGGRDYKHMNEIAEDAPVMGPDPEAEEDARYLKSRGLCVFTAADYTNVIGSLWPPQVFQFGLPSQDSTNTWI